MNPPPEKAAVASNWLLDIICGNPKEKKSQDRYKEESVKRRKTRYADVKIEQTDNRMGWNYTVSRQQ